MGWWTDGARRTLGLWIVASVIGGLLGTGFGVAIEPSLFALVRQHATSLATLDWGYGLARLSTAIVATALVMSPTALVLGRRLPRIEPWWIAVNVCAAVVMFVFSAGRLLGPAVGTRYENLNVPFAGVPPPDLYFPAIAEISKGFVYGAAQAILLSRYVRGAAWWTIVSIAGYAAAGRLVSLVNWQLAGAGVMATTSADLNLETLVTALLGPMVIGLATGLLLARLLRETRAQPARSA